jgi:regulator of sirC expression with transglutaminase-like and TPR domain
MPHSTPPDATDIDQAAALPRPDWPFAPTCCEPDAFALLHEQTIASADGVRPLDGDAGLVAAACAVASHADPTTDMDVVDEAIEDLADDAASVFDSREQAVDRAADAPQAVAAYLHAAMFDRLNFRGDADDFYHPHNSFLPRVLERRRGLPISLSLVYKLVAGRLGLRAWGVGLPGHFVAGIDLGIAGRTTWIDAYHGGRVLDRQDAAERVAACAGPDTGFDEEMLRPVTHRHWATRLIQNLLQAYTSDGRHADVAAMLELEILLWPDQPHLRRDLGLVLARLGQTRPASRWLGSYLQHRPNDPQRTELEELLTALA